MTTIARFRLPEAAPLFRSYLEAREISAYRCDEHLVQLCWQYSTAIGGVRVVVNGTDAQSAIRTYAAICRDMPGRLWNHHDVEAWCASGNSSSYFPC